MTTADNFAKFNSKGLANYEDWDTYFMTYLRESVRKSVVARWSVDGTIETILTLTGIAGGINVTGNSWQTDGQGHILDVAAQNALSIPARQGVCENSNGVTYYVANFYGEVPTDVRPSPRTGALQYGRMMEVIGRMGTPNAVVDNGNGTMTFTVDSVTEAGITNAGRTIRGYKKVPGLSATTLGVAVEDRVVSFTGGANKITTVGKFGQPGTPSTTASDYVVVCLGPAITRNEDLRNTVGAAFIGTFLGVGGASVPISFTHTDQRLLKGFDDATQILYTPASPADWPNPDPTTAQTALDAIIANLKGQTAGLGPALIGNVALPAWKDATVIAAATLKSQLDSIINAIAGNTGDLKMGASAKSGSTYSLLVGTLSSQLQGLLDAVNDAHADAAADTAALSATLSAFVGITADLPEQDLNMVPVENLNNRFGYSANNFWSQDDVTTAGRLRFVVSIPLGLKLKRVKAIFVGAGGHSALPGTMPRLKVEYNEVTIGGSGAATNTSVADITDSSSNVSNYEKWHVVDSGAIAVPQASNRQIQVQIFGETGANSVAGGFLLKKLYAVFGP